MKPQMIALALVLAALAACGSSPDDKIVMKDPSNGSTRTCAEVRDLIADGTLTVGTGECSEFAANGESQEGIQFPEGQAAFVEACEAGLKAK